MYELGTHVATVTRCMAVMSNRQRCSLWVDNLSEKSKMKRGEGYNRNAEHQGGGQQGYVILALAAEGGERNLPAQPALQHVYMSEV